MDWIPGGLVYPNISSWVLNPVEIPSESNLIKLTWLSEGVLIKSRLLLRRVFVTGEVSEAKIIYPSDKPVIFSFNDFSGFNYQIGIRKLLSKKEHFSIMVHYQ